MTLDSSSTPDNLTYDEALAELQGILADMQSNALDIDQLTTRIQRASALLDVCQEKLQRTEAEVQAVLKRLGLEENDG
jgi:exodeoxyribonuclease VII small subunit